MHWPPSLSKHSWPIGCWVGACCINAQMLPSCLQHVSHSASVVKHVTPFGASCFEMHWPPSLSKHSWPGSGCWVG